MRTAVRCLGSGLLLCGSVITGSAQAAPRAEVGTMVGVTVLSDSRSSITHFGIPGDGIQSASTLYATVFTSPSVMVEPQLAFSVLSGGGGQTLTAVGLAVQVGHLFTPAQTGSAYVAANGAFQVVSLAGSGRSASGPGVGAAVGYRFQVAKHLAIRTDLRYRRWFSDFASLNEIGIGLGFGATL